MLWCRVQTCRIISSSIALPENRSVHDVGAGAGRVELR